MTAICPKCGSVKTIRYRRGTRCLRCNFEAPKAKFTQHLFCTDGAVDREVMAYWRSRQCYEARKVKFDHHGPCLEEEP